MDRKIDFFPLWIAGSFSVYRRFWSGIHGVARFAAQRIRLTLFYGDQKIIHRKIQFEQREIRLQIEPQFGRRSVQDVVRRNGRFGSTVKSDHLSPFKPNHIKGQFLARRAPVRLRLQERFEAIPEVAKGERFRGILGQIGGRHFHEPLLPDHGAKSRIVIIKTIQDAKPILPIVDLQALKGTQAIIRLDKLRRHLLHGRAIGPSLLHSPIRIQRAKESSSHHTLQLLQLRA